jgi:hypothetical protein
VAILSYNILQLYQEGTMRLDIKFAILKAGKPQYQVAQAIGVSEYALSKYIRGRAKLTPEQEARLSAVLGLIGELRDEAESAAR